MIRRLSPFIPYMAVGVGMYALHSAWAAILSYHAGILLARGLERGEKLACGNSPSRGWILLMPIVFAMGGVALYVLWPYLGRDAEALTGRLADYGITRHAWPLFAIYFCIANSGLEELFWRGYLGSDARGLVVNDVLFGGYHSLVLLAFGSPIWAAPVIAGCAFGGWMWRRVRTVTGGLTVPIMTHLVADISIVIAVHLRAFR